MVEERGVYATIGDVVPGVKPQQRERGRNGVSGGDEPVFREFPCEEMRPHGAARHHPLSRSTR
jgi:hypothetical protein